MQFREHVCELSAQDKPINTKLYAKRMLFFGKFCQKVPKSKNQKTQNHEAGTPFSFGFFGLLRFFWFSLEKKPSCFVGFVVFLASKTAKTHVLCKLWLFLNKECVLL